MTTPCDIGQTNLLDWLYGELEASESARFEQHMEDCAICAKEAAAMSATRQAARALELAEPPAAMAPLLLREAARRVPDKETDRPGFFAWLAGFFGPVLTHPAMATAACVILVAGISGVLYLREGSDLVATPEPGTGRIEVQMAEAPEGKMIEPSEAVAVPPPEPLAEMEAHAQGYTADLADQDDRKAVRDAEKKADLDKMKSEARTRRRESAKGAKDGQRSARRDRSTRAKPADKHAPGRYEKTARQTPAPVANNRLTRGAIGGAADDADFARDIQAPRPDSEPSPSPAEADLAGATSAYPAPVTTGTGSTGRSYRAPARTAQPQAKEAPVAPPPRLSPKVQKWADGLLARLRAAGKKQRCSEVARLANDLLDRVPRFYSRQVAGSDAVRRCRTAVASERQRRVEARRAQQQADRATEPAAEKAAGSASE